MQTVACIGLLGWSLAVDDVVSCFSLLGWGGSTRSAAGSLHDIFPVLRCIKYDLPVVGVSHLTHMVFLEGEDDGRIFIYCSC